MVCGPLLAPVMVPVFISCGSSGCLRFLGSVTFSGVVDDDADVSFFSGVPFVNVFMSRVGQQIGLPQHCERLLTLDDAALLVSPQGQPGRGTTLWKRSHLLGFGPCLAPLAPPPDLPPRRLARVRARRAAGHLRGCLSCPMAMLGPGRRRGDAREPSPGPLGAAAGAPGDADPDDLRPSLEHALDAARRTRRPLTLVALELPDANAPQVSRFTSIIRHTVRDTDGLWSDGPAGVILVLVDADGPNSEPALARLRMRLRSEGMGAARMGRAAPAPGISAEDLLALARADRQPIARGGSARS